jgi:hypothetical protein
VSDVLHALRSLRDFHGDEPEDSLVYDEYAMRLAAANRVAEDVLSRLGPGPLRAALVQALECYREAGDLWRNQIAVRRSVDVPLNLRVLRLSWACGDGYTVKAERLAAQQPNGRLGSAPQ